MTKIIRYKFIRTGNKSESGDTKWEPGAWREIKEPLNMCYVCSHCSEGIYQAFSYVHGEILARVEVKGQSVIEHDK